MTEPAPPITTYDPDLESATTVACALLAALTEEEDEKPTFEELDEAVRENLLEMARGAIKAFAGWMVEKGFRILPKGVVLTPQSDAEAAAMNTAVQAYIQAKARKSRLVGSVAPGLLVPGKLNGKTH